LGMFPHNLQLSNIVYRKMQVNYMDIIILFFIVLQYNKLEIKCGLFCLYSSCVLFTVLPLRISLTFIFSYVIVYCLISIYTYQHIFVVRFSGLSICDCPFGILWRLFVLCLVYPMLSDSLDFPFVIAPLVVSDVYLSYVLCTLCCQILRNVYFWLPLWYSLTFIYPGSCVPYGVRFSGLYIFDYPFGILWRLFVLGLVYPMLSDSPDCLFLIAPLVFSDVYLSCVFCTLWCQILWIVYFWLALWFSLTIICPVSSVPYVVRFSGLSICDCPFGILWRLFVLCLVYPMLPVSLDCLFVITPSVFSDVY
jgi:hypothetical protein